MGKRFTEEGLNEALTLVSSDRLRWLAAADTSVERLTKEREELRMALEEISVLTEKPEGIDFYDPLRTIKAIEERACAALAPEIKR